MIDKQNSVAVAKPNRPHHSYDRTRLTYAETFDSRWKRSCIHLIEFLTAKPRILRLVKEFERRGPAQRQAFWGQMLDVMGITCGTPTEQLGNIPKTGATIIVANHPHGLVDGLLLAQMIGQRRSDYRILTRSILTGIDEEASKHMIAVPFPHEPDAQRKMIAMRSTAMDHLEKGGLIALFPSGVVASSDSIFGPAVEREWNVFSAKMIRKSGATVVPVYFPGSNSRAYQIANRVSATLRQGLLLHEIVHALNKPQAPIIGQAFCASEIEERAIDPRDFVAWLRAHVLDLGARTGRSGPHFASHHQWPL
ncbi:MAG: lysophospholipid acyltransferase family protein [Pseudomonadota bacterium]